MLVRANIRGQNNEFKTNRNYMHVLTKLILCVHNLKSMETTLELAITIYLFVREMNVFDRYEWASAFVTGFKWEQRTKEANAPKWQRSLSTFRLHLESRVKKRKTENMFFF